MAARIAPNRYDRLHHFILDGIWDLEPIEKRLAWKADRLIAGSGVRSAKTDHPKLPSAETLNHSVNRS
ncbi:MAG: hypothetical protein J2P49_02490 [Methylocapsa sp.]|nr:hypothetical protein [Methylocapsa sp.]